VKKIFSILFALVLVVSLGLVTAAPVAADPGTTYYVSTAGSDTTGNGTAGNPWRTIQYAIGQVSANDTIMVAAGLYGSVVIDKSLTLKGAQEGVDARTRSGDETIIEPHLDETGISILNATDRVVVIDGLTVQNAAHGITTPEGVMSANITVRNVRVLNPIQFGISITFTARATVEYCYVEGAEIAINAGAVEPFDPTVATFRNNEVVKSRFGITGYLGDSLIEGNVISDFSNGGVGISCQCLNTEIRNNNVTGYVDGTAMTFEKSHHDRPISENVKVKNNNFTGNRRGIYVWPDQTELKGITVNFNNIAGNSRYGVQNDGGETLDATKNWWGDASGPDHWDINPDGEGDRVSDSVDFEPWLGAALITVKTEAVTDDIIAAKEEADTEVTVNGTATVTLAQYAGNPGGDAPRCLTPLDKYIDIYVPDTTEATELEIKLYYTDAEVAAAGIDEESLQPFSWNDTAWVQCSDSGINTASDYIWARISNNTTPSLADLQGTPLGGYGLQSLVLFIATAELPDGEEGEAYEAGLEACVGAGNYTWAIMNGGLPDGLALATDTGTISGTPTRAGVFDFTVTVTDAAQITATAELSITITQKDKCFFATAAYGTDTAEEIDILREFRDKVLLPNSLGARFVSLYYRTSPPIADFISRHEVLKTAVRVGFVDPIVRILNWSHDLWL